jgi:hypothetical protein
LALLAEALVEEWLNRKGYFTIRGVKVGNSEIDLLAVSFHETQAVHVEVSASTDAKSWTCPWPKRLREELGYRERTIKPRTPEQLEECVDEWVRAKYLNDRLGDGRIAERRENLCPDRQWCFMFVHGDVKYPEELDLISERSKELLNTERGVELLDIREVLAELEKPKRTSFRTSSEASDFAALLDYYRKGS